MLYLDKSLASNKKVRDEVIFRISLSHEMPILVSAHVFDYDTIDKGQ